LPTDPVAAAESAVAGRRASIDLGAVNGCFFFNVAGVGLSADVAKRLARGPKRFGPLSYLFAVVAILRRRRAFRAVVSVDGTQITLRSIQLSVANGRRHGGGLTPEPEADIQDGRFDIYSLAPQPWWRVFALVSAMRRGTHDNWRGVTLMRGERVHIQTPREPKRVNADGELVTETPAQLVMHRGGVVVLRP
jgi:diacylglycerol kinase family enzyme